jgi:hypothetical protein
MNAPYLIAFAALASASLLLHGAPASAAAIADARQDTHLAVDLLADAHLARQALLRGDTGVANDELNDAAAMRDKLARAARANGTPMILPLYPEFDDTTVLSLAMKSRSEAASHAIQSTPAPALTSRSNIGQVTYLAIDLDKAKIRLDAARLAIRNRNDQAAMDSLARMATDLIQTTVSADEPLLTVRQDLVQAQNALRADNYPTASADLQQASASLKKYGDAGHHAERQRVVGDIDSSMPVGTPQVSGLSTKIDGWWSSVTSWFSQPA